MANVRKESIESKLSKIGFLELQSEERENFEKIDSYSLCLSEDILGYDLADINVDVYYLDEKVTKYELGKYGIGIITNSKGSQKRLMELIVDTELSFLVEFKKIEKNSVMTWDRYITSIRGATTTNFNELLTMIKIFKQFLLQVKQEKLDMFTEK